MAEYKRFIVFAAYAYYPEGGMNDVSASFDSAKEAVAHAQLAQQDQNRTDVHILDTKTRTVLRDF